MTEIIFSSVFFVCVGFVIGKLFKGLNPFKLLFGVSFGFAVVVGLVEANNNWYTGLFILGFILNYGNPFQKVSESFEDFRLHRMYKKSLQQQKSTIEANIEDQVNKASKEYAQKQEALKREKERLRREKEEFERQKSSYKRTNSQQRNTTYMSKEEALKILGLSEGFSARELSKAYKRESVKFHPDKGFNQPKHIKDLMEKEFKNVNRAYEILKQ